eukprot:270415-Chlamydomonas_euryale.AAC.1
MNGLNGVRVEIVCEACSVQRVVWDQGLGLLAARTPLMAREGFAPPPLRTAACSVAPCLSASHKSVEENWCPDGALLLASKVRLLRRSRKT